MIMTTKKTHVWIFYLISAIKDTDYIPDSNDSLIYAYTNKKHLAEEFMLTRNMDNYFVKEFNLSKDDLNDLYNVNMRADLEYIEMRIGYKDVKVPVTMEESRAIRSFYEAVEYKYLFQNTWIDTYPLKKKYVYALERLLYTAFNRYILGDAENPMDGFLRPNYLNILMDLYRDYFISPDDFERGDES